MSASGATRGRRATSSLYSVPTVAPWTRGVRDCRYDNKPRDTEEVLR